MTGRVLGLCAAVLTGIASGLVWNATRDLVLAGAVFVAGCALAYWISK